MDMIVVETMVACAVGMYVAPPVIRYPSPAILVRTTTLLLINITGDAWGCIQLKTSLPNKAQAQHLI